MNEKDDEQGLAHFLEHLVFCGTNNFKPGELIKYFQSIGMQFGPDANGRTGFYETVYDLFLPKKDPNSIDRALLVMNDYACQALLLPEEISREKKVVLAEITDRDSSSFRIFKKTLKFEFPDAMISKRLPLGKEEIIEKIDRPKIKAFYEKWYRPDNMVLVMVGDFDKTAVEDLIEKRFGGIPKREEKMSIPQFGNISHKGLKAFYHFEKDEGHTEVCIETATKSLIKEDSFDLQKKRLLQDIANSIIQDRINELIGKGKAPFTSASINSGTFINNIQYASISAECNPENWSKSLSLIDQILRQSLIYGFKDVELKRAKARILSDLNDAVKKSSTRSSSDLASKIISSINDNKVFQSPMQKKEIFAPVVERLTLQELKDSINAAWQDDHRLILLTGNAVIKGGEIPAEMQALSVYEKSQSEALIKPDEKKAPVFPYLEKSAGKGEILSRLEIPDLGITQIDFKNKIRLNLKKTDFKSNEVQIKVAFGSGRSSEPPDYSGISYLAEDVINESGLNALSLEELNYALAGKETKIHFNVEEDHFSFEVQTTTGEIGLAVSLIYAHLIDPGFRENAYKLAMNRFNQEYESLSHSIEGAVKLYGIKFLAGNDSRFGFPSMDEFNKLSLADIKSWIIPALNNSPVEVNVVGDFNAEDVIKNVSEYLGSLPERKKQIDLKSSPPPVFPLGKPLKILVDTNIIKGIIIIAYPTDDIWDIKKTRRLSVLSEIFSEKLRKEIREKLGASYSPQAFNHPSRAYRGYGLLQAVIETSPQFTDQVINAVQKLSCDIVKSGVTSEELKLSLDPILTGIKDRKRDNGYWLKTVLSGSSKHPEQIEWSRTIIKDYSSITKEEISQLAKQYLDDKKAAVIVVLPK
jgi:zinc protease